MGKLKRSELLKKNQKKSKLKSKLTIEELLDYANQYMDQCDLETAYKYVKQALDMDPKHIEALETMAAVQMEMGNSESAKNIYEKLIELSPNEGFSKYMCLAQLSSGLQAVNLYLKGIDLMIVQLNQQENQQKSKETKPSTSRAANYLDGEDDDEEEQEVSKTDISTAFGSVAELYLTDLCMEENADSLCKTYLEKSLEYDPKNPESLQLFASYWLSKEDLDQAKKFIVESVDVWLPQYIEADENGFDPTQAISLTYDSRINTSRILTEVNEYEKAITVLEQLLEEDDEVVVVWYMLGWVNYCKGQDSYSVAKFYLKKAHELATKIKYEQKYLDNELRVHISELLGKLVEVKTDNEEEEDDDEVAEDKENRIDDGGVDDNEDEYETTSEDEEEDENNNLKSIELKVKPFSNGKHEAKTRLGETSNNKNQSNDDSMELT